MMSKLIYGMVPLVLQLRVNSSCAQVTLCLSYFPVHDLLALSIQAIANLQSIAIQDTHIYSSLAILDAILYFTKQHEILNLF